MLLIQRYAYASNSLLYCPNSSSFSFLTWYVDGLFQIFIGNLDPNVSEDELKQIFVQFGEVLSVKIPVGRGCGFVQFGLR